MQQVIVYVGVLTLLIVTCNVFAKPLDNEAAIRLQAIPPEKLDPKVIKEAMAQPNVPLVVYLSDPFLIKIAREEQEMALPELEALSQSMKLLLRPFAPNDVIPEPIRVEHRNLKAQQKAIISQMRRNIYSRIANRVAPQHEAFSTFVRQDLQGNVGAKYATVNAVVIEIPSEKLTALVNYPRISRIILNEPLNVGFELEHSMPTTGAEVWHDNGYDGSGDPLPVNVGVLDSGVKGGGEQEKHQALPTVAGDGDGDKNGHGTKVAGVIASHNSTNKGMLPGISKIYSKAIFDEDSYKDLDRSKFLEGLEWAVQKDIDVLNCSFGLYNETTVDEAEDDYTYAAQDADGYASVYMISIIKSAGNRGTEGDKTITLPADSYNAIVVGNMNDQGDTFRGNDELWSTSSRGPTYAGRKKPDITAPGRKIMTTALGPPGNNNAFHEETGTSVAAPHVTGAIGILMDWGMYHPLQCKALLLNSADDWSPDGPDTDKWDKHTGWGYLNLQEAWEGDNRYNVMTSWMQEGEIRYCKGTMTSTSKATLVWNKSPEGELSNFDMYLYEWDNNAPNKKGALIDYSDSPIDNIEQVVMDGSTRDVLLEIRALFVDLPNATDFWSLAYSDMEQGFVEVDAHTFQFLTGFNSIGLPVRNPDKPDSQQYTSYTLIPAIENCNAVSRWNAVLQLFEDAIYIEEYGIIIGKDFSIALGEGYFLLIAANTQWPLLGSSITEPITLNLERYYNLISIPYPPNAYDASTLMAAVPAEDVIGWDVETQSYVYASEGTNFPIETDEGYFVLVAEDTSFTPQAAAPPLVQEKKNPALQAPKKLFPKISNVTHANITSKSATIFWNTDITTDGIVHYGTTPALGLAAKDTRDDGTNHWVVIKDLKESQKYYYRVVSGKSIEDNDGLLFKFTTSQVALRKKMDSSLPVVVYGQVLLLNGEKAEGEIILFSLSNQSGDSLPLATLTDANGYWLINLWNLKDSVGKVFNYQVGDKLLIDDKALGIRLTTEITKGALQDTGLQIAPVIPKKAVAEISEGGKAVVETPEDMKLAQNFPNPFNPDTWIPYQLSSPAQVVIKIYNVQGQLIRTLDLGRKDAGYYTTKERAGYWDGKNARGECVASGVYFYTIKAGNFVATKKLAIVK